MMLIIDAKESLSSLSRRSRQAGFVHKSTVWRPQNLLLCTNARLGGALERRRDVQAPQEHFQRQSRVLEVGPEQLQVGASLAQAGDRQLGRAQRLLDVARQGVFRPPGGRLTVPGVPDALGQAL